MTLSSLIAIPLAFTAGIVSIVLLQYADVIHVSPLQQAVAEQPVGAGNTTDNALTQSAGSSTDSVGHSGDTQLAKQLDERMDSFQQQLRDNTLNADRLQVQVEELELKIELAALDAGALSDTQDNATSNEAVAAQFANSEGRPRGFRSTGNDVQFASLVEAGVDPLVAEQLKRQNDQWTLQSLELVDQATREGWRRSDEFSERMQALREQRPDIRQELGEESYDRYLFAAGDFNRVEISSIIDGSAAQLAGIQNGDVVMSYADDRVFSMRELQRSTSAGSRGENIQVQVLRNGEIVSVDLPRGPLGVTLSGKRVEP